MKRHNVARGLPLCRTRYFLLLSAMLACGCLWRISAAEVPFVWFKPANGSFNSATPWLASGEETRNPDGSVKDPNPNGKIPGSSDSVGFSGDADSPYEVSIVGGDVSRFFVSGSFNRPSLTQPVTFNISGTMSAGYLSSVIPAIFKGGGELYGKQSILGPNQVFDMTVTGGTTLRIEEGNISLLNLTGDSTAILSDVVLGDYLLKPAVTLTDSTLKTGAKIGGQTVNMSRSEWDHNSSGLGSFGIATLSMEGGSRFSAEGAVTLNNIILKESSTFTVGSLTNPFKGISVSGSGLFAKTAIVQGGIIVFLPNGMDIMFPADITKDSKVELGSMDLEQGWLRVSDRSKLRNGSAKMGAKGAAGILVDDKGSEWTVTNQTEVANVRVRRGGFVQFGNLVTRLSAVVENGDSELRFVTALNADSLRATGGATIRGQSIDLRSGSSENSEIYLTNAFNLGLGISSSFSIVGGGYLECRQSVMGADNGGSAAVTVSGEHSFWLIHEELSLGEEPGTASLSIDQGGRVVIGPGPDTKAVGRLAIGRESSVTVSGLTSLLDTASARETTLGYAQQTGRPAELKVLAGGSFTARKLFAGYEGEANITIQGANSSLDVSDDFQVGTIKGKGMLTMREGALAEARIIQIDAEPGKESSALVTGSGSTLTAIEGIDVGVKGVGVLTLAGQAILSLDNSGDILPIRLGVERFSKGTLVIDGGSAAIQDRSVRVGYEGTGILSVSAGGSLKALNCIVGFNAPSSGSVVVTGTNQNGRSSFQMQDLHVGFGGGNSAVFDINASGAVRVGKLVRIYPHSTLRFNDGSLSVGVGGDSARDCTIWPGGTLILSPGGNLIGSPGMVICEGGTLTTIVPPPGPLLPSPSPNHVSALAPPASSLATISSALTIKESSITVVQFDPSAAGSDLATLRVTGPVILGGKLKLEFMNGFAPLAGQKFKLFDFQSTVTGQFAQIEISGLAPGFQYEVKPDPSGLFTFSATSDGIATSPPQLSIVRSGAELTITWPATAQGFSLQSTKNLGAANWQPLPSTGNSLKVSVSQPAEFFRLVKP